MRSDDPWEPMALRIRGMELPTYAPSGFLFGLPGHGAARILLPFEGVKTPQGALAFVGVRWPRWICISSVDTDRRPACFR